MAENLLLMFDRPGEPIYVPKGDEKKSFNVPPSYLPDEFQNVADRILNRFGNEAKSTVEIKNIAIPDMSVPLSIGRHESFSIFLPKHRRAATYLINLFLGMRTIEDLIAIAAFSRDRVNPQMFIYCLSVAIITRKDTKNLNLPQLSEVFPDRFMDSAVFTRARELANIVPAGSRTPIEIPKDYTATDVDPEHRVAYWREDVGLNLHHWHWHLIYPFDGPMVAVNKDRRGELFYYHHHQLMARYNIERLCNGLPKSRPLTNLREPIPEAYFPKMDQAVAGRAWPARPQNMILSDINRTVDNMNFTIADMERFRDRILEAIRTKTVRTAQGQIITLDDKTGIDILGNILEASSLSPNQAFYGDLHNYGHIIMSFIHDPDHRYLESFATIGDPTTAMRDPVFYRWHQFVDDLFTLFKDSFPAYSSQQLNFPGVSISDVRIITPGSNPNTLNTHWTKSDVDLSRGLDFVPRGSILARLQHLNHDHFSYNILINNSNNRDVMGTIRIFAAPRFDSVGRTLSANEQRMLMIEMDKFVVRLQRGQNSIVRQSTQSAVTIPFEATFRNLERNRPNAQNLQGSDAFNYCGCGLPMHLLLPKGHARGFQMDLFLMISNYEFDRINQPEASGCVTGVSFCGLRDMKYPDAQAMGYPFDRTLKVNSMREFLTPNMRIQPITIRFSDVIKPRQ